MEQAKNEGHIILRRARAKSRLGFLGVINGFFPAALNPMSIEIPEDIQIHHDSADIPKVVT